MRIADIAPPRADQKSGLKYEQVDMCDDAAVAALAARMDRMDVVFLASPASNILTGVTIAADGGYSVT